MPETVVGVGIAAMGAAETLLLVLLIHPFKVCVAEMFAAGVLNTLGFPLPPSLQDNVPVTLLALMEELPQVLVTAKIGAVGTIGARGIIPVAAVEIQPAAFFAVILYAAPPTIFVKMPLVLLKLVPLLLNVILGRLFVTVIVPVLIVQVGGSILSIG